MVLIEPVLPKIRCRSMHSLKILSLFPLLPDHWAKYIKPAFWGRGQVAVKVQRADIHKTGFRDLEIIGWFARQLHARVEELRLIIYQAY